MFRDVWDAITENSKISEMDIGLVFGGAFLSSGLQIFFDRLAPQGELFQKQNKQASNQSVNQWLDELRDAVDSAENLMEEVNYEALRLKVEGQHQNLAEIKPAITSS
ncbi:hypothetical protein MTR67_048878 [Solanum verrucosum]|uniref:Disease resistance N-terminal domain-containing protein n=1 Tax=Solanum verrucosum TaxID=315347 RepID=A0AAF0UYS6_SOLVR|nr:hypothetical protein MTR67_048878 [Solanum verrucosum]